MNSGVWGSEYLIGQVRTLDQDKAFEKANRLEEEAGLRRSFIRKFGSDPITESLSDMNYYKVWRLSACPQEL